MEEAAEEEAEAEEATAEEAAEEVIQEGEDEEVQIHISHVGGHARIGETIAKGVLIDA